MLDRKKQMHVGAFSYLIEELAFDLSEAAGGPAAQERWQRDPRKTADAGSKPRPAALAHRVVQRLRDTLRAQEQLEAGGFADDGEHWQLNQVSVRSGPRGSTLKKPCCVRPTMAAGLKLRC